MDSGSSMLHPKPRAAPRDCPAHPHYQPERRLPSPCSHRFVPGWRGCLQHWALPAPPGPLKVPDWYHRCSENPGWHGCPRRWLLLAPVPPISCTTATGGRLLLILSGRTILWETSGALKVSFLRPNLNHGVGAKEKNRTKYARPCVPRLTRQKI